MSRMDMSKIRIKKKERKRWKGSKGDNNSEHEGGCKEGSEGIQGWSDWIWEEKGLFWYRALKKNDTWQYEYAEINKEETQRFVPEPNVEFLEVEDKIIFVEEEKAFEIERDENIEHTFAFPTEGSVDGNNPGTASKEKDDISISSHGSSPNTQAKTREEMRAKLEEESPEQSVRVERVREWRAQVNGALQEDENIEEGEDYVLEEEPEILKPMKLERVKRPPKKERPSPYLERKRRSDPQKRR